MKSMNLNIPLKNPLKAFENFKNKQQNCKK